MFGTDLMFSHIQSVVHDLTFSHWMCNRTGALQFKRILYSCQFLGGLMRVGLTFNDHEKGIILSYALSWITTITHFAFDFTSRVTVLCLCGESDSVLFPADGERKKEENEKQAVLRTFNVPADGFVWEVWCSVVCPFSLLYHTMTVIPWELPRLVNIQPHGFMFHHYLLMFGLVSTPEVCCFLMYPFYRVHFMQRILAVWNVLICKYMVGWEMVSMLVMTGACV